MIRGILPPLTTPFIKDEVAYAKLKENISKLNQMNLSGFVVLGSNGETVYLTREEKLKIIQVARENVLEDKLLIAGTGIESIKETVDLTNQAARIGADMALVLPPSYYPQSTHHQSLLKYYYTIADKANIPIIIYNVPKFTGCSIDPAAVAELANHPNIIGIKDSVENIAHLAEIIQLTAADFSALVGTGSVLYPGLCVGATGGILALANIAAHECIQIQENVEAGNHREALKLQMRLLAVNKTVTAQFGVSGLKAAMDMLGFYGGTPRLPLLPLNKDEWNQLKRILIEANLIDE